MIDAVARGRAALDGSALLFAGTCAIVVLMSNNVVAANPGGATLYLGEALTWLAFLPACLLRIAFVRRDPLSEGLRLAPEFGAYVAVVAVVALLAMGLEGSASAVGKVKNILPAFLFVCLVVFTTRTDRRLELFVWCIVLAAAVNAAVGLVQLATGGLYIVPENENNVWKEGLSGTLMARTANGLFETPNSLGVALIPGLVLGARLLTVSAAGWTGVLLRLVLGAACLVVIAGLVASANRGALIWAIVGCVVAFAPLRSKGWLCVLALGATTAMLVVAGLRGLATDDASLQTLAVRLQLWDAAAATFLQHPTVLLFGDGEAQMSRAAGTLAGWSLPSSHNTWLDQIVFFGAAGLGAYLAVWAAAFARALRARALAGSAFHVALADGLLGSLVAMAGLLVLEPRADGFFAVAQVGTLCALAIALARRVAREPRGRSGPVLRRPVVSR